MGILGHALNTLKAATRDVGNTSRSLKWPGVEHAHLKLFPCCAACGSTNKVQVHHQKPFHLHPELELDPNNLISLCMDNDCHILIGHGDDFKAYNPNVVADAAKVKADFKLLHEVATSAKTQRLFE